jgi:hypothetical protein
MYCFPLFSIVRFWKDRKLLNTKRGPLGEAPEVAREQMKKAAPGLQALHDLITAQKYPGFGFDLAIRV